MKLRSRIVLVVAIIATLFLVGWTSKAQRWSTDWEYKIDTVYGFTELPPPNVQKFNELGDEGWELVTVRSEQFTRGDRVQTKLIYYFKRPR